MSEQVPVRGIVLAHGTMAEGLVDAVRLITGTGEEVLVPISNRGIAPDALAERLSAEIGTALTIVFTDLEMGSCGFAARRLCQGQPNLVVISGVNLPVLLEFAVHRALPLTELVPRLLAKGQAGISCAPADWDRHVRSVVSSR